MFQKTFMNIDSSSSEMLVFMPEVWKFLTVQFYYVVLIRVNQSDFQN